MPTYIDSASIEWRGMKMSHIVADTLDELHTTARHIGLKPDWFQGRPVAHYDVCNKKRTAAIKAGALPVSRREMGRVLRRLKQDT